MLLSYGRLQGGIIRVQLGMLCTYVLCQAFQNNRVENVMLLRTYYFFITDYGFNTPKGHLLLLGSI